MSWQKLLWDTLAEDSGLVIIDTPHYKWYNPNNNMKALSLSPNLFFRFETKTAYVIPTSQILMNMMHTRNPMLYEKHCITISEKLIKLKMVLRRFNSISSNRLKIIRLNDLHSLIYQPNYPCAHEYHVDGLIMKRIEKPVEFKLHKSEISTSPSNLIDCRTAFGYTNKVIDKIINDGGKLFPMYVKILIVYLKLITPLYLHGQKNTSPLFNIIFEYLGDIITKPLNYEYHDQGHWNFY